MCRLPGLAPGDGREEVWADADPGSVPGPQLPVKAQAEGHRGAQRARRVPGSRPLTGLWAAPRGPGVVSSVPGTSCGLICTGVGLGRESPAGATWTRPAAPEATQAFMASCGEAGGRDSCPLS